MNGRVFLDTNCIIYLYSVDETSKREKIISFLRYYHCFVSSQVLSETVNVLNKKFNASSQAILKVLTEISMQVVVIPVDLAIISKAIQIKEQYKFSFYDSQIVSAALMSKMDLLLTEDLQHGQTIGHLKIVNPFLG